MPQPPLPVDAVAPALRAAWEDRQNFVLTAPTGSGKSTRVPAMVAELAGDSRQQVLVLQPRRMAARWLARRVASEYGGSLGERVGYQIRHETRAGKDTQIVFITEGILLRRLQSDPSLSNVRAILFDEFHERHLQGDMGLAVARDLQKQKRADLRLGVMSATLDATGLLDFLAPAVHIAAEGRTFPVEIEHLTAGDLERKAPVWQQAVTCFRTEARAGFEGDCLIFMPGAFEIRKTLEALRDCPESRSYELHMLHGEMAPDAQDDVFAEHGRPKVIVATNIAETSLTLPGVRLVIDSGLARIAGYDPNRGINTLLIEPISQASADQRAGRAGRVAPGRCVRLWTAAEQVHRPRFLEPEIHRLDLAEPLLALHRAGYPSATDIGWFEAPSTERIDEAELLLGQLDAVSLSGGLTARGTHMARLPLHPRLAALVLEAQSLGFPQQGCLLAALVEGRSILVRNPSPAAARRLEGLLSVAIDAQSDHLALLIAWNAAAQSGFHPDWGRDHGIHTAAARQAGQTAHQLLRILGPMNSESPEKSLDADALQSLLLAGFSDNVARRLNTQNYAVQTARGRRGEVARSSSALNSEWLVATAISERTTGRDVSVLLEQNTALSPGLLKDRFPLDFTTRNTTRIEGRQRRVITLEETFFRSILISSRELGEADPQQAAEILARAVLSGELVLKQWNERVEQWIARVNFLARSCPDYGFFPFTSEDRQLVIEQICYGSTAYSEFKDRPVQPFLDDWLPSGLASEVDRLAPVETVLGEKKRFRYRYPDEGPPIVSGQIQKFYDIEHESLAVAGRQVLPRIELLAPNQRPIQVTDKLDDFWSGSYPEVKKQLFGRYPRHEWR